MEKSRIFVKTNFGYDILNGILCNEYLAFLCEDEVLAKDSETLVITPETSLEIDAIEDILKRDKNVLKFETIL